MIDLSMLGEAGRGGLGYFAVALKALAALTITIFLHIQCCLMGTDPKTATPLLRALSGFMSSFAPKLGVIKLQSSSISRDPLVVRSYVSYGL